MKQFRYSLIVLAAGTILLISPALFAATINGEVKSGNAPIGNATVTLWAAGTGAPKQLAAVKSGANGSFGLNAPESAANREQQPPDFAEALLGKELLFT